MVSIPKTDNDLKNKARLRPRALSIASFNARGLRKQMSEIREFALAHSVDFLLIQETNLKPTHVRGLKVPNFHLLRNDRMENKGGGTAIYYNKSLHCMAIATPNLTNLEATICKIAMSGHHDITIASVYQPPTLRLLGSDLAAIFKLSDSVIIVGDLNSKNTLWNCASSNTNGRLLEKHTEDLNCDLIAPLAPTHFPDCTRHRPDILDIALLRNVSLGLTSIETLNELDSDHRPILLKLGTPGKCPPTTKTITDWPRVATALENLESDKVKEIPEHITSIDDISRSIHLLTEHINNAVATNSRQIPIDQDRCRLPTEVRELIREKNRAVRAYDSFPSDVNKSRMRALQREVRSRIREARNSSWETFLESLNSDHLAYWKLAKSLKSDLYASSPPLLRPHRPSAFSDVEKAECLADSLTEQCTVNDLPVEEDHLSHVTSTVAAKLDSSPTDDLEPVSASELSAIIRTLNPKKAPGPDGISNRALKCLPAQIITLLAMIFNACLSHCHFPKAWKEANVIGIPKPGKPLDDPKSYRPISLLNTMGKVFEIVIHKRLKVVLDKNNTIINEQYGFQPKHSCPQQIQRIVEYVTRGLDPEVGKPQPTVAVFFDVAKAFDRVWHEGLLYKLILCDLPDRLIHILGDFLRERSFRYRVEGTLSSSRPLQAGVPQGSVLSPALYTLFTNDIPRSVKVNLALFADDTALYFRDRNFNTTLSTIQDSINTLGEWFRKWRIQINPDKSAAIIFTRGRKIAASSTEPLTLYELPIPWKSSTKYLGVTLDSRLNFHAHINMVRKKASFVLHRLGPMLNRRSKLSLSNKLTLYKTCIRPIFTYASPSFAHASPSQLRKLQIIQNRCLRKICNCPFFVRNTIIHRDLKVPAVAKYMKEASERFFKYSAKHNNPLIASSSMYMVKPFWKVRRPKNVLLDDPDPLSKKIDKVIEPPKRTANSS